MTRKIFLTYIRGWFIWLVALVAMYTEVGAQNMGGLLADEFGTRRLLQTEPITVQQPKNTTALALLEPKFGTALPPRPFAYSATELVHVYAFEDCWITPPAVWQIVREQPKTRMAPIPRHYYADNIFDIDDTSNPFALPRQRKQFALNETQKPGIGQRLGSAWSEIMVLDNPELQQGNPLWLAFIIFGMLGMLAIQVSLFRQELMGNMQAFVNGGAAGQVFREEQGILASPSNILLASIYSISVGIFVFLAAQILAPAATFNTFAALSLSIAGAAGLYVLKSIQIAVASWLFPYRQAFSFYGFIVNNTNKVLGFSLAPLVLFLAYAPAPIQSSLLYISIASIAAILIYRNFKALNALSDIIQLHKFYFFLYLCTAEIAPWLIALKLLSIL